MSTAYKTFAFISYSHRDMAVAKWLQKKLEGFKLPTEVHNDIEAGSRYLRPIFRDQSDLNTGILGDELRRNLEESKFLLLICSKNSAQSQWVSDEAKAFVEMGRLDRIIPVIIPDKNTDERDLFPIFLRQYFAKHPDAELLGVNIGEVGKAKSLIRIVSRMLGVSFDSLWQRHKRQQRLRIAVTTLLSLAVLAALYLFALPVRLAVNIDTEASELPVGNEIILTVDGGEYTAPFAAPTFTGISVPGYKRFSTIDISAASPFFTPVGEHIPTGFGLHREINIALLRDDSFANFIGSVYDDDLRPIADAIVSVSGISSTTDCDGHFSISLPLGLQRAELPILIEKTGYISVKRDDETPGTELKFIMHRQ